MRLLLLCTLSSLSLSLAGSWVSHQPSHQGLVFYHNNRLTISCAPLSSLESVPSLFLSGNRKMRPPPRVQLDVDFSLLLLLAGDVSLNPGLHLGTFNALRHSTKSYTTALKCTFLVILLWQTHSVRFSFSFALPSSLTHTHLCRTLLKVL